MIRGARCRSTRRWLVSELLAVIVAGGGLVGCTTGLETPADAVALFDGGRASAEELARHHSESSTAPNGGLIPALRPGMTDRMLRQAGNAPARAPAVPAG